VSRQSKEPITVDFLGQECVIQLDRYRNGGRVAMTLLIKETGEEMTVATVNVPEIPLKPDEVLIKDYSENEGLLKILEDARIVRATGTSYQSGYVKIPKCMLSPDIPERFREGDLLERVPARSHEKSKEQDREI